ncbi:9550_t:CDS:2, partial [Racocetra persica]
MILPPSPALQSPSERHRMSWKGVLNYVVKRIGSVWCYYYTCR